MATTLYATEEEVVWAIFGSGSTTKPEQQNLARIALQAASRQIDKYCDRPDGFGRTGSATSRSFIPENAVYCFTDDIAETDESQVTVQTDENGDGVFEITWQNVIPTPQFQLEPRNASVKDEGRPFNGMRAIAGRLFPPGWSGAFILAGGKRLMLPDADIGPMVGYHQATVQITAHWGWPAVPSPIHDAAIQQTIYLYKSFAAPFGIAGAGDMGEIRMLGEKLHPAARSLCNDFRRGNQG
jgi:hypothetical protein